MEQNWHLNSIQVEASFFGFGIRDLSESLFEVRFLDLFILNKILDLIRSFSDTKVKKKKVWSLSLFISALWAMFFHWGMMKYLLGGDRCATKIADAI